MEHVLGIIPNSWPENFADKLLRLCPRLRGEEVKREVENVKQREECLIKEEKNRRNAG